MKPIHSIIKGAIALSITILWLVAMPVSSVLADSEGPRDPGTGSNNSVVGTEPWVNPNEITTPGSAYATVNLYHLHLISNYLQGTHYGFAVPSGASIVGIEVRISRMASANNPSISDNKVRLVKAGTPVGDDKAMGVPWPTTLGTTTYGGPQDLWGTTWTPNEVNSTDFGIVLSANRDNNGNKSRIATVDSMQITVYYENTPLTEVVCGDGTAVIYGETVICEVTVSRLAGDQTPSGFVNWTTGGSGAFDLDPCTLSGADGVASCTTAYTPAAVGNGTHLVTATYAGDSYFSSSSASQSVTVNPRPVTVTADPQTKVFTEVDPELTYQITDGSLVFGDEFTGALTRDPGEIVGEYALLQGTLELSVDYDLTYVGDYLTITKADATCEITPYAVTYDGNPHTAEGTCTGVIGEPLEGLDLGATTHTDVGTYNDLWAFTDVTGNYNDTNGTVMDEIAPRYVTVVADSKTKLYGQPDPEFTYQVTDGSLLPGDAFSGALTRQLGNNIGTYAILQGTLSLPEYYEINYVVSMLTITGYRYLYPLMFRNSP
jgi:hypothetical protein